jgi:LysM repeat protein
VIKNNHKLNNKKEHIMADPIPGGDAITNVTNSTEQNYGFQVYHATDGLAGATEIQDGNNNYIPNASSATQAATYQNDANSYRALATESTNLGEHSQAFGQSATANALDAAAAAYVAPAPVAPIPTSPTTTGGTMSVPVISGPPAAAAQPDGKDSTKDSGSSSGSSAGMGSGVGSSSGSSAGMGSGVGSSSGSSAGALGTVTATGTTQALAEGVSKDEALGAADLKQTTGSSSSQGSGSGGYLVEKGDTLSGIAGAHDVTVSQIVAANSQLITNPDFIKAGWHLTIPAAEQSSGGGGNSAAAGMSPDVANAGLEAAGHLDTSPTHINNK